MQFLRQRKRILLTVVLLVAALIVTLIIVQKGLKTVPTSTPSPAPTSVFPTLSGSTPSFPASSSQPPMSASSSTPFPVPSTYSPVPTGTSLNIPVFPEPQTPLATPSYPTSYYPGEVTQYQGINLTPISVFVQYLIQHPDVAIAGWQNINQATYRLAVTGLVNNSFTYTYDDVINNFTSYDQVATLLCVEDWSVTMLWEGVRVSDLLQQAGVSSNATVIIFHASDGYTTALPIDFIAQNNIMLAYKMNNVTLPASAGFPFMLIAQNQYVYKWIKWVTELEVSNDTGYLGYWESQGYPNNATVTNP